jgi:uncharacterized protein (TIGR03083 family)
MTADTDATIAALRATHDELATVVGSLSDEQLSGPSGATEWTVAQVLSHLGSGAEIALGGLRQALDGTPRQTNEQVWDRWNAMAPREQADGFLAADARLVESVEGLDDGQRQGVRVDMGFLPEPVPVLTYAGMRLNEAAHHSWDVRVALDPGAAIDDDTASLLLDHFAGDLGFLLGWTATADTVGEHAVVSLGDTGHALEVGERVSLVGPDPAPTAALTGTADHAARLLSGRLRPEHTPEAVRVTGNVSLDDLRKVFPGY